MAENEKQYAGLKLIFGNNLDDDVVASKDVWTQEHYSSSPVEYCS